MTRVSLNVDLGELPGEPEELYALATVVNIACGGHAGDASSMQRAVELALRHGTRIAAHPSYPDRAGFGRTSMVMKPAELERVLGEQCGQLLEIARRAGATVSAVKPHGALYHDAARDPLIADVVLRAAGDAPVVGPPKGVLREKAGAAYIAEGFADRGYRDDRTLVPRTEPGALLVDPAACVAQALRLARSGAVQTLCVHSDTPHAVEIARAVRTALLANDLLG